MVVTLSVFSCAILVVLLLLVGFAIGACVVYMSMIAEEMEDQD